MGNTVTTGKTFQGERIVLDDGTEFRKCSFANCDLVFTAKAALRIDACHIEPTCRVGFESHAAVLLETLSLLYPLFTPTVDDVFARIRGDNVQWQP